MTSTQRAQREARKAALGEWRGRRLHFVGVGGAGMSGLALVAAGLGATVSGSDREESPYLALVRLHGARVHVGHSADQVPPDAEVVVSTAIAADNPEVQVARERGQRVLHRADLLAELTRLRRTIAVSGTHGKTTTAAMIVHVLDRAGCDPSFVVGAKLRGFDTNARLGSGAWLVVEADESDRSFLKLDREIAVITNIELDHHSTYRDLAELEASFAEFARPAQVLVLGPGVTIAARPGQRVVRVADVGEWRSTASDERTGASTERAAGNNENAVDHGERAAGHADRTGASDAFSVPLPPLPVPGRHNVLNALAAVAAAEAAGVEREQAARALADFAGTGRRLEFIGHSPEGARVYDDYAHHPTEVAATLAAARELMAAGAPPGAGACAPGGACARGGASVPGGVSARGGSRAEHRARPRLVACFQPHLFSRTKALAREFGRALAAADIVLVSDVFPARERPEDWPGVSGLDVARAAADRAAGKRVVWAPRLREATECLRALVATGDTVVVMGAGNVDRVARALARGAPLVERPPAAVERDKPLARLTTVRTGGNARFFARAATLATLHELLAWAACEGLAVEAIGSGSNLLVADEGVDGLVIKLEGELAAVAIDGEEVLCGGGARLPQIAARTARAGLSGLEFAVNIPGTVGGAVRMNANAYGGELASVLVWVEVATPAGVRRLAPDQLGFAYRRSALRPGEVVARALFRLRRDDPAAVRARLEAMRTARREAQPSGIKTFGSTFTNPDPADPRVAGRTAGMLLDAAGCRGLRVGGARFSEKHANFVENLGDATTADIVRLMAEGRRRVFERFGVVLEPEVRFLGPVDTSPLAAAVGAVGGSGPAGEQGE